MKVIGITGGAGSGKSEILKYLEENYPCRVLAADEAAHKLMMPGGECYPVLLELFAAWDDLSYARDEILLPDGSISRTALAGQLFADEDKRRSVNEIVHPAVRAEVLAEAERERAAGCEFFFLEAALLIEGNLCEICDEMWYIYSPEAMRRKRLKESRGYSDERIDAVFSAQLPESAFFTVCDRVIDNGGDIVDALGQIREIMGKRET